MKRTLLLLCSFLASLSTSFGWSMPGHMIVTAIAYCEFSPTEQAQLDTILADHFYSQKWDAAYPPGTFELSKPFYRALLACLYPDEIRDYSKPETFAYWHFVDYPLDPPNYPLKARPQAENDVVYGIEQSEKAIETDAPGLDRGKMLSFLLHLVGDIHQPLHCESTFSDDFTTPDGDKGGNYVYVEAPAQPDLGLKAGKINLHAFWDEMFGTGGNPLKFPTPTVILAAVHKAQALKDQIHRDALPELAADTTPISWSIESRTKAIQDAWLNGQLHYTAEVFPPGEKPAPPPGPAPALPDTYTTHAHEVADRCIVLAGYRLADELHRVLHNANAHGLANGDPNAPHFDPVVDNPPAPAPDAPAAAPTSIKVWVNTKSGVYWREGSEYYGQTKQGKYLTEADALAQGYHPGHGH